VKLLVGRQAVGGRDETDASRRPSARALGMSDGRQQFLAELPVACERERQLLPARMFSLTASFLRRPNILPPSSMSPALFRPASDPNHHGRSFGVAAGA
jgi:hypothetical protein